MRKSTKSAVVAGTVLALTGGGVAFAYWTTSGNGSGSAATGDSSAFTVETDAAVGDLLTPGGPTQTITFHVTNENSGVQRLQAVVAKVANDDGSAWNSGNCSAADFDVSATSFTAGDVASGATKDGTFTISMKNLSTSQDDCKNVTVPLYVSAS